MPNVPKGFYAHHHGNRNSEQALNARFKATSEMPKVECPVCGGYDNDWPERDGLCCNCWCAAWCIITDAAPEGAKPTLAEVQHLIHRMVNGRRFEEFAEKIRQFRYGTGTLRPTKKRVQCTAIPSP